MERRANLQRILYATMEITLITGNLYCSGDAICCGKDTLVVNEKPLDQKQIVKLYKDVLKVKIFGFGHVGFEIPNKLYAKFSEMKPLLQEISDCNVPEEMNIYKKKTGRKTIRVTKKLLGVTKAKKIFLYKTLNCWYMQYGMRLTVVHQLVEYAQGKANATHEAAKNSG